MSELIECGRCHEDYEVRGGCDPTEFCDSCAHDVIDEQRIRIKELELRSHFLGEALKAANAIPNPVEQKLRELLKSLRTKIWNLEWQLKSEKITATRLIAENNILNAKLMSYALEPPTADELRLLQ